MPVREKCNKLSPPPWLFNGPKQGSDTAAYTLLEPSAAVGARSGFASNPMAARNAARPAGRWNRFSITRRVFLESVQEV